MVLGIAAGVQMLFSSFLWWVHWKTFGGQLGGPRKNEVASSCAVCHVDSGIERENVTPVCSHYGQHSFSVR